MQSLLIHEIEEYIAKFSPAELCSSNEVIDALLDIRTLALELVEKDVVKGELISA